MIHRLVFVLLNWGQNKQRICSQSLSRVVVSGPRCSVLGAKKIPKMLRDFVCFWKAHVSEHLKTDIRNTSLFHSRPFAGTLFSLKQRELQVKTNPSGVCHVHRSFPLNLGIFLNSIYADFIDNKWPAKGTAHTSREKSKKKFKKKTLRLPSLLKRIFRFAADITVVNFTPFTLHCWHWLLSI